MFLTNLKIHNFRNLERINIDFDNLINYFYAPNGIGKTNLLESIQCLSIGKSLRAQSEMDLINFHKKKDEQIVVTGKFLDEDNLDFTQTYSLETVPKKKKTLLVNKNKTSINTFIGRIPSIWFSPESIKIINSSPRNKRKYFDDILIQLYPEYLYDLRNYNRALQSRNKLLQENSIKSTPIRIWTEQLIKYGAKIIKARQKFFNLLNESFEKLEEIPRYKFKVEFRPNIKLNEIFDEDSTYTFYEELRKTFQLDKRRQSTTSGPHRDEWHMLIKINDETDFIRADKFASRGQQRMSLIMLQMVLIKIFQQNLEKKPILLLDDIFSELDEENEKLLISFILKNSIQSFITGVEKKGFKEIKEINLQKLLVTDERR